MTNRVLLLIGVGNPLRGDDGVGPLLAGCIAPLLCRPGLHVCALPVHQLTPELALEVAREDVVAVVFIDAWAAQDDDAPTLTRILDDETDTSASHNLSAAAVLVYAGRLYNRRPPAWLLMIPGCDFSFGDKLSPKLAALVESPAPLIHLLVETLVGYLPDPAALPGAQKAGG